MWCTGKITIISAVVVLSLGSTAAVAQFGGVPNKPFDAFARPPAPDYTQDSAWAALPDRQDAADVAPANAAIPEAQADASADVFYIHPTTYRGGENWNQNIAMADVNTWTDISVIARQASAFNGCCKIYAPRYRQATISAMGAPDSGLKAYDFAYGDVVRAWHQYVENWNDGRPFIIVSHSQGTLHAVRLLEEEIDGTPLAEAMIAAYVVGIGVPEGTFGRGLKNISRCTAATDTGCVISWNTFGMNGNAESMIERTQARFRSQYETSEGQNLACWNPVSASDEDGWFDDVAGHGALPGVASTDPLPALIQGPGAACQNGVLLTEIPSNDAFQLMVLEGENLHMHDFDLFYGSIRANAVARTEAFLMTTQKIRVY